MTDIPLAGQVRLADQGHDPATQFQDLELDVIREGENPRTVTDEQEFARLCQSIADRGVRQPIQVRPAPDGDGYVIVAGHRRYQASRLAGRPTIPAVIATDVHTDADALETGLVENLVREAMDPVDEAHALAELMRRKGIELGEAARRLRISHDKASRRMELLCLPDDVKALVASGGLAEKDARSLARIARTSKPVASALAQRVITGTQSRTELNADPAAALRNLADDDNEHAETFVVPFTAGLDLLDVCDVADRAQRAAQSPGAALSDSERAQTVDRAARVKTLLAGRPREARLVEVSDDDSDRAVAARVIVAYQGERDHQRRRHHEARFLIDCVWAADWALHHAQALQATTTTDTTTGQPAGSTSPPTIEDAQAERQLQREQRLAARADNLALGARLHQLDHQTDVTLDQAMVIGALIVDVLGSELANGLRITRPEWLARNVRTMASGEIRSTERVIDLADARGRLDGLLTSATTGPQLIGRLFGAVLAAACADQTMLAQTQRREFALPYTQGREDTLIGRAPGALWTAARDLLPDRLAAQRKPQLIGADSLPARDRLAR